MTDDLTGAVVRTALETSIEQLSPAARTTVTYAMLDHFACVIAASDDPAAAIMNGWVADLGGRPESSVLGAGVRVPAPLAALANGTAAHALDFDDVAMTMIHPSAAIVPGLLSVGERNHSSGAEMIAAYAAGFEVDVRICRAINPEHYGRGWHTIQSVGVLGATLAVARLAKLPADIAVNALGIAASSASGIRKNFGSMVKPLHAGHAAQHAVEAVDLATRGFTGNQHVLDGTSGFLDVFSSLDRRAALLDAFAESAPAELDQSGVAIKRFACCGALHTALDSLEALLADGQITFGDVRRVECRVNPISLNILVQHNARTGLEGKFSVEYSLAVYLLTGRAGLAQYTDEQAADPRLRDLMSRVEVIVDDTLPVNLAYFPTVVTLELHDGSVVSRRTDVPHGYPDDPLSLAELTAKVVDCCTPTLDGERIAALVDLVTNLEACPDVSQLGQLLAAPPRVAG